LQFELDQGVKKSIEIAEILRRVLPSEPTATPGGEPSAGRPASGEEDQTEALDQDE
jgi:hypothetical protein